MRIVLPEIPLTANQQLRQHWSKRTRATKRWAQQIAQAVGRFGPWFVAGKGKTRTPPLRMFVEIRVARPKRLQDLDNFFASLKPILDGLRKAGFIYDDSRKWLELVGAEVKSKTGWTEIQVRRCDGIQGSGRDDSSLR